MDITEKFKEIDESGVNLKLQITAKIYNLHGQGVKRQQLITKHSYEETATETTERGIKGSAKHNSSQESLSKGKKVREKIEMVSTFPSKGNSKLLAPLGGHYGYIMGAMKNSVTRRFGDTSKKTSVAYGGKGNLAIGTTIEPEWIEIADKISNELDSPLEYLIPTAKTFVYFDYVKESLPFTFTITVESGLSEEVLLGLLAFIQRVGLGPKRRGIMKVLKVEVVD